MIMKKSRQGRIYTERFVVELEKEVIALEKKDPYNGGIFRKVFSDVQWRASHDWEMALYEAFEYLERFPFLRVKPETMEWARLATECADEWPPPYQFR